MNIKTIITIVIALMVSLIILFIVPKEETLTPKNVYRVYLAGKSVGLISDKDSLDEYIDKEQENYSQQEKAVRNTEDFIQYSIKKGYENCDTPEKLPIF